MVVVDCFTEMAHFIPIAKRKSSVVAKLFLEKIWKYHGLPTERVSDRDGVFTGHFIADLYQFLGIKWSMLRAFHLHTDGQTEQLNRTIEHYGWTYCKYERNNWKEMLAMAKYTYNYLKHTATKITLFYANYRCKPFTNWPTKVEFKNPSSELYTHYIVNVYRKLETQLESVTVVSSEDQRWSLDRWRRRKESRVVGKEPSFIGRNQVLSEEIRFCWKKSGYDGRNQVLMVVL